MKKPTTRRSLSGSPLASSTAASIENLEGRVFWSVSPMAPMSMAPMSAGLASHADALIVPFASIIPTPGIGFDSGKGIAGAYSGTYRFRISGGGTFGVRSAYDIGLAPAGSGEGLNQVVHASAEKATAKPAKFKYALLFNTGLAANNFLPFTSVILTPTSNRTFTAKATKNKHTIVITGTLQKNNKTFTGTIKLTGPNQSLNATYTFVRVGPAR